MRKTSKTALILAFILITAILSGCTQSAQQGDSQSQNSNTSMYCGNGFCQKGFPAGETIENCPQDCSEEQQTDQNYWKVKEDLQNQKDDMNAGN